MSLARPKHSSPWVVDTRMLGRRPGQAKRWSRSVPAATPIGLAVIAVPADADVQVDVLVEAVAEGVLVSGAAAATAAGECARCLTPIEQPVRADFRELYAYPDSATAATTTDDEIPRLVDDLLDLEPLVVDELVLALPLAPLCRSDCPGLCVECGERLAELGPTHSHDIIDSRWSALLGRSGGSDREAGRSG